MRDWIPDIAIVLGAGLVAYGIYIIYTPAGIIAAGVFSVSLGIAMARGRK